MVDSGPCVGLTMEQVMRDRPDAAYNTSLLRGRGDIANACRAYLKVQKAHDELLSAFRSCELKGTNSPQKPSQKPCRNSKTQARAVPLTETLALVPFQGPISEVAPKPRAPVVPEPTPAPRLAGFQQWLPEWS